jgi:hypothetical protein
MRRDRDNVLLNPWAVTITRRPTPIRSDIEAWLGSNSDSSNCTVTSEERR